MSIECTTPGVLLSSLGALRDVLFCFDLHFFLSKRSIFRLRMFTQPPGHDSTASSIQGTASVSRKARNIAVIGEVRIVGFAIRASLAGMEAAGENLNLYIADQVFFGVGFFGLLYSAYTLVLDRYFPSPSPATHTFSIQIRRWQLSGASTSTGENSILRLTQNRRLFRLIMLAAVVIGVVGATKISATDPNNGKIFRTISSIIFLVLTALLAVQTALLTRAEAKNGYRTPGTRTLGGEHGSYILCVIALLLLVREAFTTATIKNTSALYNEHFWYPLYALPELLAVALYATPGLVPPRSELPQ
ncbi:hypothetical protein C0991_011737 [Blastosporella zonata]|nr:hypothetical protein C0991_011737 [Blastosporella zonata]